MFLLPVLTVRALVLYVQYSSYLSDEDNIAKEQRAETIANNQQSTRNETKRKKETKRYKSEKQPTHNSKQQTASTQYHQSLLKHAKI